MSKLSDLPFANGQWRLAMGLKPLVLSEWIEIGDDFKDQLAEKITLLEQRYKDVVAALPGSEIAQQEVLNLLISHLLHYFPQYYEREGDRITNQVTHQTWKLSDFAETPLDLAGRLVQEDFCLMLPGEEGYVLAAASLCFPSRWRLRDKLGHPLHQIHQEVPGYADALSKPVDQFFDRLKVPYPGYRLNWSIVDSPTLHLEPGCHNDSFSEPITSDNAGERLWLRVERQTLRRLEQSRGILFTIRTSLHPMYQVAESPAIAQSLASTLQKMPAAMQVYKSLEPIQTALMGYLTRARRGNA